MGGSGFCVGANTLLNGELDKIGLYITLSSPHVLKILDFPQKKNMNMNYEASNLWELKAKWCFVGKCHHRKKPKIVVCSTNILHQPM